MQASSRIPFGERGRSISIGLTIGCMLLPLLTTARAAGAQIPPERQAELLYLLRQDCGACHGMRLKGGLGPALQPRTLSNQTIEQLALTILYGRPGTPMPPWQPFLSPAEARWLAGNLKRGAPP